MSSASTPVIAGREAEILALMGQPPPRDGAPGVRQGTTYDSAFACALHMHQPTVPDGPDGALISHLQYMFEHGDQADHHNAEPFAQCYRRMADILPELIAQGCQPRIMLDYSGNLLWGLQQMGREDVLAALRFLATDATVRPHVEFLGSFWGHAVASSTPIPDLELQILAWQHQFADLFGNEALQRVRGFSLPEMHLPNHPDTLHALVTALTNCGFRWLLLQEHSVENPDGSGLRVEQTRLPNRLVARNGRGETASILALIKTQGSDTKLVGQMQPCFEAVGLGRQTLAGLSVPSLVTQIADGENGGVMMNEFPSAFRQAHQRLASGDLGGGRTVALNGSEYLDSLESLGVPEEAYPPIQAVRHHRIWQRLGEARGSAALEAALTALQAEDPSFAIDGASWTNSISWVEGYANVLEPMQRLSARFHQLFDPLVARDPAITRTAPYQEALLHVLLLETSCFRYWGQGIWTDRARAIHRAGEERLSAAAAAFGLAAPAELAAPS